MSKTKYALPEDPFEIPAWLKIPQAERNRSWIENPPQAAAAVFQELKPPTDPATVRFLEEMRQLEAAKKAARFEKLKRSIPRADRAGMRWDAGKCRWVPEEFTARGTRIVHEKPGRASRSPQQEEAKVAKKAKKAKKVAAKKPAAKKASAEGTTATSRVIRVKASKSPYKDGSKGDEHFQAMKGGVTVSDYLDTFDKKRKNASQWLGNMIRAGHVELLG